MWYAITGGAGLLLGLVLLIWALRERSKRSKAEEQSLKSEQRCKMLSRQVKDLSLALEAHKRQARKDEEQLEVLRTTIDGLRRKLVACQDPETISSWLDSELSDVDV